MTTSEPSEPIEGDRRVVLEQFDGNVWVFFKVLRDHDEVAPAEEQQRDVGDIIDSL